MFVHPEPGRRVFSHIRLERIPAGLRDLLMGHPGRIVDLWMENNAITSSRQRFAMRRNNGRATPLVKPGVRGSHAGFQSETINRHRALTRRDGKVDQERRRAFSAKHFVKPDEAALTRNKLVPASLPGFSKDGVEQRVL